MMLNILWGDPKMFSRYVHMATKGCRRMGLGCFYKSHNSASLVNCVTEQNPIKCVKLNFDYYI